jgi:molybdopterin synthase sulfur carrier subunit
MVVNVLFFGQLTDVTGVNAVSLEGIDNTDQLLQELRKRFPILEDMPYAIAVEMEFVNGNISLKDNDTVALLPPYSGG